MEISVYHSTAKEVSYQNPLYKRVASLAIADVLDVHDFVGSTAVLYSADEL
jgi:hypothetical protein